MKLFKIILSLALLPLPATALDILGRDASKGGQGVSRGLQVLYRMSATRGGTTLPANTIGDESGVGTALDLNISNTTAISRKCDNSFFDPVSGVTVPVCYLDFALGSANAVKSTVAASKIVSACKASNELTIEMWMRNDRADQLTKEGRMMPLKIMTLGRNASGTSNGKFLGSSNDSNFYFGLDYQMAPQFSASVRQGARTQRNATVTDGFTSADANLNMTESAKYAIETSQLTLNSPDSAEQPIVVNQRIQQVIYTYSAAAGAKLYVSSPSPVVNGNDNPFAVIPVARAQAAAGTMASPFSGWNDTFFLSLGNEATYASTSAPIVNKGGNFTFRTENREWRGEIYLLAVYCNAHTEKEILGNLAPGANFKSYPPNPAVAISPELATAAKIYDRLVGVKIPITAPILSGVNDARVPDEDYQGKGMAQKIAAGDLLGAASLATSEDAFYNITVRDFAKRMSTRDETVNTPLNDMVTTIIGTTRDNIPATQLLTGNYYYMGDPAKSAAPSNMFNDLLMSNNHYERLESLGYNLRKVIKKVDGQKVSNGTASLDHPDPAGILTSRAFMAAHAIAGTNRRMIEFSFREFMCIPISGWADSTGPDNRIGKDVDRYPGGDHTKFLTTCRSCHSNQDGLRGAFAKFNFNNNFVKHADIVTQNAASEDAETATTMCQNPAGVACKLNRNADLFPDGYQTVDSSWINNAYRGGNVAYFGWSQAITGTGAKAYGQMLSGSQAFPRCMAKRVFRAVCKRDPATADDAMISRVSQEFVNDNYNLRMLFARTVISPECLGIGP